MRVINKETIIALTEEDRRYFHKMVDIIEEFVEIIKEAKANVVTGEDRWLITEINGEKMINIFKAISEEQYLSIDD